MSIIVLINVVICVFVCANKDGRGVTASGDPNFTSNPTLVAVDSTDFQRRENFLRGCLWLVYSCLIFFLTLTNAVKIRQEIWESQ